MGFDFVRARFGIFRCSLAMTTHLPEVKSPPFPLSAGMMLILVGVIVQVFSLVQYRCLIRSLNAGQSDERRPRRRRKTAWLLFLTVPSIVRDQPLAPAWSPDHQIVATTKVPQAFVTPEGGNYSLLFNGKLVYLPRAKRSWFSAYEHWHSFLSPLAWSPDSQRVAFVEKIYSWE